MISQKNIQLISLISILVFIPSITHAESLTELDRQLDQDNIEKINQITQTQKQPDFDKLNCPKGTYHGLDNLGNDACRDFLTNQIVQSEISVIPDSTNEIIPDTGRGLFADSREIITDTDGTILLNDSQTDYVGIGIISLIGIAAGFIILSRNKILFAFSQIRGWSQEQKEQIRNTQYGRCYICYKTPSRWVYDYIDGDKSNHDISNCQGLCPKCKSEKLMIRI